MQSTNLKKSRSFRSLMNHRKGNSNSLPRQRTIHSGWLWKKGIMKSPLANKRWFEIKGDQLFYFKAKGDEVSLGQIPLAGNEVKKITSSDTNNKYSFRLVAGEERQGRPVTENFDTLLFAASTPYELDDWIKAINRVIYSPMGGGMFGRPINETMQIDCRRGAGMVPILVELCVEYIKKHGLMEEGIFRIPGAQEEVDNLKNRFNTGSIKEIKDGEYKVHIVASVLKKYLGDLPKSVIPPENYDQFIAVGGLFKENFEEALKKFKPVLTDIPKVHFNLLKYLCRFLHELQLHHKETKMTVENLAVVFAPNFLRPKNEDPAMLLKFLTEANTTTVALINNQEMLFPVTDDESYYDQNATSPVMDLIDFDSSDTVRTPDAKLNKCQSKTIPRVTVTEPLTIEKRSLSDSSLVDIVIENERTKSISSSPTAKDEICNLRRRMVSLKKDYEDQIYELERKLDSEKKVQEMLKIRLSDEQRAREAVESRLEIYRTGIEEYCRKFGHVDISIP